MYILKSARGRADFCKSIYERLTLGEALKIIWDEFCHKFIPYLHCLPSIPSSAFEPSLIEALILGTKKV
ncbi:TPA: hypothetical protein DEA21_03810 [Candidatus Uhrbacteria bacterium]|nr:hypothetical protein [Candidatus Uhrbacteria bacterium]